MLRSSSSRFFVVGELFSRDEIHDVLGGSKQSYLPRVGDVVTCGCFDPRKSMNPNAPEEILFGRGDDSPEIVRCAELVFEQGREGREIPVFLKRRASEWEFVGDYLCIGITRDERVVARKKLAHPQRGEFNGALRFERVGEEDS